MTNNDAIIYETVQNITKAIFDDKTMSLEIASNKLGSVVINSDTKDFTYIGNFGNDVLKVVLKCRCSDNLPQKIAVLSSVMFAYRTTGGFVFLSTMK